MILKTAIALDRFAVRLRDKAIDEIDRNGRITDVDLAAIMASFGLSRLTRRLIMRATR